MKVRDLLMYIDDDTPVTIYSMNDRDVFIGNGIAAGIYDLIDDGSIVHNIYIKDNRIWIDILE